MKALTRLAVAALILGPAPASAENWPCFRGPTGQGIAADPNPPLRWSATENVAWKTEIPGEGWSSPIVWGDRIFLTSATDRGTSCHVICVARDGGKLLWDVEVFKQPTIRKEGKNSWATPTPVTDGKRVYAWFTGGVAALSFDGKIAWTNQENVFYGRQGLGASMTLYKDELIIPFDGSTPVPNNGGQPSPEEQIGWLKPWEKGFVIALDTEKGQTRWKTMRGLKTRTSHVTPGVIEVGGQKQVIAPAGDFVQAFDPDSGERLWWVASGGETPVPSVVYGGGLLFITSGFPTNLPAGTGPAIRAIRPGNKNERGDLTATNIVWESKRNVPTQPSFVFVEKGTGGEHLLVWAKENGVATCADPKDGETIWQERLEGTYSASPTLVAGKIYLLNEAGKMTVIEASGKFKVLAENRLEEKCQASPAFCDGQIILRTDKHLLCVGQRDNSRAQQE